MPTDRPQFVDEERPIFVDDSLTGLERTVAGVSSFLEKAHKINIADPLFWQKVVDKMIPETEITKQTPEPEAIVGIIGNALRDIGALPAFAAQVATEPFETAKALPQEIMDAAALLSGAAQGLPGYREALARNPLRPLFAAAMLRGGAHVGGKLMARRAGIPIKEGKPIPIPKEDVGALRRVETPELAEMPLAKATGKEPWGYFAGAETGKPFEKIMYRVELAGRKDPQRGIFYTDAESAKQWQPIFGGKIVRERVQLTNPLIVDNRLEVLNNAAKLGNKEAVVLMRNRDVINTSAQVERFLKKDVTDMGFDGLIVRNNLELIDYSRTRKPAPEILPAKVETPPAKGVVKEPWEMTREEFERNVPITPISKTEASNLVESGLRFRYNVPSNVEDIVGYAHKRNIIRALSEGKPVPPEVLKDYPELAEMPLARGKEFWEMEKHTKDIDGTVYYTANSRYLRDNFNLSEAEVQNVKRVRIGFLDKEGYFNNNTKILDIPSNATLDIVYEEIGHGIFVGLTKEKQNYYNNVARIKIRDWLKINAPRDKQVDGNETFAWLYSKHKQGKFVPPEILADYPDLAKAVGKEPWEMTQKQFIRLYEREIDKQIYGTEWLNKEIARKVGSNDPVRVANYYISKYPELKGYTVERTKGVRSYHDAKAKKIQLGERATPTTARHEIEHVLDAQRGFTERQLGFQYYKIHEDFGMAYEHRQRIKIALAEGKPIPPEVLKDYPDLAAKAEMPPAKAEIPITNVAERPIPDWRKFVDLGYTEPTAKSRAIIDPIVEHAEGHPGKGSIVPWSIRLTKEGAELVGESTGFITKATRLHEIANIYESKIKDIFTRAKMPLAKREAPTEVVNELGLNIKIGDRYDYVSMTPPLPRIVEVKSLEKTQWGWKAILVDQRGTVIGDLPDRPLGGFQDGNINRLRPLRDLKDYPGLEAKAEMPSAKALRFIPKEFVPKELTEKFEFENPEIESRYKAAKGIDRASLLEKTHNQLVSIYHKFTREFEHLPRGEEFAQLAFDLRSLAKQKAVSSDWTNRRLFGITKDLSKNEFDIFSRKVLLNDFAEMVKEGKAVSLGMDAISVPSELSRLNKVIADKPQIREALKERESLWNDLKGEYTQALKGVDFDVSDILTRENYFRHQVLEYANAMRLVGAGKKLKVPTKRGFLRERVGSELDINTDYLQAEYEVMAQMRTDIAIAKTIKSIQKNYDISAKVKKGEIPEGYVEWQPREGHIFYLADTIPARLAKQLWEGTLEEIGISKEQLRKSLSMGKRRKAWIVKEEVAKTLDNLGKPESTNIISRATAGITKAWKQWVLISPPRFFKYNVRNLSGDADAVFVGNPSAFRMVPRAINDLKRAFSGLYQVSKDLDSWLERGGMKTTLQVQEISQVNLLDKFSRFQEKKWGDIGKVPSSIWKAYWRTARLGTDFREAVLRYAAYLDYSDQIAKSGGKPRNFGASLSEEVMALKDFNDRAFMLSNDLLGAYDRISIFGEAMRKYLYPFWSWQELNFKRMNRFARNSMSEGNLPKFIGKKFLGSTAKFLIKTPYRAYRIGKFVGSATAAWTAMQVWNNLRYPEEEKSLPDEVKNRPHLILGVDAEGNIIYFSRLGMLGDFLDWFGLDAAPGLVNDWMSGRKSIGDIAEEMAKSPVVKFANGINPFFKMPAEIAMRQSLFPDVFEPRLIRDRGLYLARQLGMEEEYRQITKIPSRPYSERKITLFAYKSDPEETAYNDIRSEKARFLKKIGRGSEGYWITPRSEALYNLKMSIKYNDPRSAAEFYVEYVMLGGNTTGLKRSFDALNPLWGLSQEEKIKFVEYLGVDKRETLLQAIKFHEDTFYGAVNKEFIAKANEEIERLFREIRRKNKINETFGGAIK